MQRVGTLPEAGHRHSGTARRDGQQSRRASCLLPLEGGSEAEAPRRAFRSSVNAPLSVCEPRPKLVAMARPILGSVAVAGVVPDFLVGWGNRRVTSRRRAADSVASMGMCRTSLAGGLCRGGPCLYPPGNAARGRSAGAEDPVYPDSAAARVVVSAQRGAGWSSPQSAGRSFRSPNRWMDRRARSEGDAAPSGDSDVIVNRSCTENRPDASVGN